MFFTIIIVGRLDNTPVSRDLILLLITDSQACYLREHAEEPNEIVDRRRSIATEDDSI